jgi:hypothetical protein
MQAQSGVWGIERLDRFLRQPQSSVPDAEHRRALIEVPAANERIDQQGFPANRNARHGVHAAGCSSPGQSLSWLDKRRRPERQLA